MESFSILADDIENRIDPFYYRKIFKLNFGKSKVKEFSDLFENITDGDHGNPKYCSEGINYLRVVDVKNGIINFDKVLKLEKKYSDSLYKSCYARANDLLISIVGTLGESIIIKEESLPLAISRGFAILSPKKDDNINFEYVYYFTKTNLFIKQLAKNKVGSVQSGVYLSSIKKFKIPLPPLSKQNKIVQLMDEVYFQKQQKESEAQQLLDSIKDYVLDELGIKLPELKDKMTYVVNSDEVKDSRGDPYYYQPFYKIFYKSLEKGTFKVEPLNKLCADIFQGIGKDQVKASDYILLKVKNILINNQIDFTDIEYIKDVPKNKVLVENDIISPFIGEAIRQFKFSVFPEKAGNFTVDNNTGVIRPNLEKVNSSYLMAVLNSAIGIKQIQQLLGGGGVPFLGSRNVKLFKIPLPSLAVQNKIAEEVKKRMRKAEQLQKEAKEDLEVAKKEVEKIILGEK